MKFRMLDGTEVQGRSYTDVVEAMEAEKLTTPRSTEAYRRATAARAAEVYEVAIDASTDRSFVLTLEAARLMERL